MTRFSQHVGLLQTHMTGRQMHTQIIVVDGEKHIFIYSKRGIPPGEELCYDYKVCCWCSQCLLRTTL